MSSVLDSVDLLEIEDQTAFNLAVWEKVLGDPELARLPYRIETDRHGQLIMSPPASAHHGDEQADIGFLLRTHLPHGRVSTECPLSTSGGVKVIDAAWSSRERRRLQRGQLCLTHAPEICVEVFSPSNTRREMREKRALYFEAGAEEVWFCHRDGRMEFFLKDAPETPVSSRLCPDFPARIEIEL